MKIKKLGIIAAAAIMGISVAAPATSRNSCDSGSYSDAFWGSFNGYLAGRAVNIND